MSRRRGALGRTGRLVAYASVLLPWALRRRVLSRVCGYVLHPKARIGFALVAPDALSMAEGSAIDHLTVCRGLGRLRLDAHAVIGRLNWISGFPLHAGDFFASEADRFPALRLGAHAAITHRHIIDCTDRVELGAYATFAGYRSQILTHTIDLEAGRQTCAPVSIGSYTFVGTQCVILAGAILPDHSVLGAGSVLTRPMEDEHTLYAGVPARPVKALADDLDYFQRETGLVT
jgi:acetyltransferase-like isoleucine patch superfamily enzyme